MFKPLLHFRSKLGKLIRRAWFDGERLDWLSKQGVTHLAPFDHTGRYVGYATWHRDWHISCDNNTGRIAMLNSDIRKGTDYLRATIDFHRGRKDLWPDWDEIFNTK